MNNQPIAHPFTDYRGNTWKQAAIDTYNRFNEQVEKRERQPRPEPGTLAFMELEFYRDQRHKNICTTRGHSRGQLINYLGQ